MESIGDERHKYEAYQSYSRHPFLEQMLIGSGIWIVFFMQGLATGAPTVIIPQMRNESIPISDEMASWISSSLLLASYPWMILFPILMRVIGRKRTFLFISFASIISFIIFLCTTGVWTLILSFIILSIVVNCGPCCIVICLAEYIEPKYRGVFLVFKSISYQSGVLVANALGTFFHWKTIGYLGLICSLYTLSGFAWPESPYRLAEKEQYEKCVKYFFMIRDFNEISKKELNDLIQSSRKKHSLKNQRKRGAFENFKEFGSNEIFQPMLLSIVVLSLFYLCGKSAYSMYAIEIFKRVTDDTPSAYIGMLILDSVTVAGMIIGSFVNRIVNRRTMLLSLSVAGNIFLFILAGYLYLVRFGHLVENYVLFLVLLGMFSLCISVGPMSLTTTVYGELLPLKHRTICSMLMSIHFVTVGGLVFKFSPYFYINYGVESIFLLFGCCTLVCNIFLYLYLPETKDKSLNEIKKLFVDKETEENMSVLLK